jgi:hypothetical protein
MSPGRQPSGDEPTMILAGVLPMAFHPQARTVANIGLGSGLTTQTLLSNPQLKQVDTVEIEETVVEAAKSFRPRVDLVYTDPRSTIFIEDAKTFFSVHGKKYDIIISEPSNPWVSGVAGLFSQEFYSLINRHLTEDGLFVQWIQLYEQDNDIVLSVLKAISDNFSDFAAYAANDLDMLIVAKKKGVLGDFDPGVLQIPQISQALARIYINGVQDIALRKMGSKQFFNKLIDDAFHELVAPQVVPCHALEFQLALDDDLRGDAGVVRADDPVGGEAAHAVVTGQRIHERLLEGVAHVQGARDIGRWKLDAVRRIRVLATHREIATGFPDRVPALLDILRLEALCEFHWSGGKNSSGEL